MEKEGNPSPVVILERGSIIVDERRTRDGTGKETWLGHRRLLCFIGWLLISLIIVMASSPWNVRYACKRF
jgi:hypothetical protein